MFHTALGWLAQATNDTDRRLFINLIGACALMYEKGYRGGNVVQANWNPVDHLSRHTIRGIMRPASELQQLVNDQAEALIFNPPSQKNSNSVSEVARQTASKPAVIDLTASKPYSMAVIGPMMFEIDGDCADPKNKLISSRWRAVVADTIRRRASAEQRKPMSEAHEKRYLSTAILRSSLIVVGAPTAKCQGQLH